jgi:hypothetical protein
MMTPRYVCFSILCALALVRCSPSNPSADASDAGGDTASADAREAGVSRAGLDCVDDSTCGSLTCDTAVAGGVCTGECTNGTRASEQQQCGATGTCLTAGDPPSADSFCTQACRANTSNSGCRAGFVCTGYWGTKRDGTPDTAGCVPFCSQDSHCLMGERCNPRTGECDSRGPNPMGIGDGLPCRIPAMGQLDPCRGTCFTVLDRGTMGICGSSIDLSRTRECPEDPMNIQPLGPEMGDNLGFCIFRRCSATQCCGAGLVCEGTDAEGACSLDDPMEPNIDCAMGDGGAPEAGADSGPDASVDANRG